MTRQPAGTGERGNVEEAVARQYRALSTETTPLTLDAAVLEKARHAGRPPAGNRSRPLAWAATIALSAVFLLEWSRAPAPDGSPTAGPAGAERPTADILGQAGDIARERYGENREPGVLASPDDSAGCPDERTREAESWRQCIAELEAAGLESAAREQRRRLEAAFPDTLPP